MGYIIKRKEIREILRGKSWLIIYGRRKTGKTFLLRELCKFKNYYLVKKDLNILFAEETRKIQEFVQEVKLLLKEGKTVVVDEFQRLDESVLEEIVQLHPKGRLILSGSSMKVIGKFFASSSPLLGFFTPMKIELLSPSDILRGLEGINPEQRIEYSAFLREPWLIPLYQKENFPEFVYKIIVKSHFIISALLGEIFSEEERELSKKYASLLSLIGSGVWGTKELTNILYSRGLIPDPSPGHIIQYLKNLEEMKLVESIRLYKSKNMHFYRLCSPIMNLFYYLNDRYNLASREVSFKEAEPTLQKLINFEIQNFMADFFAEKLAGRKEYFLSPEKEIDFIITQRNKPVLVGEVKWKKISSSDVEHFRQSAGGFFCQKIMVGREKVEAEGVEVLGSREFLKDFLAE